MAVAIVVEMWGNTAAVRIPKAIAQQSGLEVGTKVVLLPSKQGLLLRACGRRRRYKLSELLAQCNGRSSHREAITGRAGREDLAYRGWMATECSPIIGVGRNSLSCPSRRPM